jgi:hypothetical protein
MGTKQNNATCKKDNTAHDHVIFPGSSPTRYRDLLPRGDTSYSQSLYTATGAGVWNSPVYFYSYGHNWMIFLTFEEAG